MPSGIDGLDPRQVARSRRLAGHPAELPNYLADELDRRTLVAGMKIARRMPTTRRSATSSGLEVPPLDGSGSFVPDYVPRDHATGLTPNATPYWMTGGCGAEVEVDTETGHVRVLRLVNLADAGTPINPRIVETIDRRRGYATGLHAERGYGVHQRTAPQPILCRLQNSRYPRHAQFRRARGIARPFRARRAARKLRPGAVRLLHRAGRQRGGVGLLTSPCSPTAPSVKPVALDTVRLQFLGDRQDTRNLRLPA